jgi:F-type H+-transporting ATPase subunit delta
MNNPKVNIRYAQALFDLALERNEIETARKDMKMIDSICNQNPDLMVMLNSPVISSDKKLSVMHMLFSGKIDKMAMGFVNIIIRKRRDAHLNHIAQKFEDLYLDYKNIKKAVVTSAIPLSENLRQSIKKALEDQTKGTIILNEVVDPEVIGGLIVKVGNQLYDDSLRQKLVDLRKEFNVNTYIREF